MPSNHSISLRFIRKEDFSENSGKKDDYAKIKYLGKGSYSIEYAHRYQGQSQNTTVLVNENGAMTWVRSMLNLIPLDMEPFYRIQVDLPHFPSVLLTTNDLARRQYEIMEAIRFSLENYPLPPRIVTQNVREENGEEEEEEEDESEEEEGESEEEEEDYSDMPPLTADDMPTPTFTPTPTENNCYNYAFNPPYQGRHLFLDHEEATSAVTH